MKESRANKPSSIPFGILGNTAGQHMEKLPKHNPMPGMVSESAENKDNGWERTVRSMIDSLIFRCNLNYPQKTDVSCRIIVQDGLIPSTFAADRQPDCMTVNRHER